MYKSTKKTSYCNFIKITEKESELVGARFPAYR